MAEQSICCDIEIVRTIFEVVLAATVKARPDFSKRSQRRYQQLTNILDNIVAKRIRQHDDEIFTLYGRISIQVDATTRQFLPKELPDISNWSSDQLVEYFFRSVIQGDDQISSRVSSLIIGSNYVSTGSPPCGLVVQMIEPLEKELPSLGSKSGVAPSMMAMYIYTALYSLEYHLLQPSIGTGLHDRTSALADKFQCAELIWATLPTDFTVFPRPVLMIVERYIGILPYSVFLRQFR